VTRLSSTAPERQNPLRFIYGIANDIIPVSDNAGVQPHSRKCPVASATERLHAYIVQEDGAFTVRVRMLNHLNQQEIAWGQEIASTIDMASSMIDVLAKQFCISENCVSIKIVMDRFKEGTFH
jgi:hypothetical protein